MNISLSPQLEEVVKQKVSSGLYSSASEVIREALRLLEEYDRIHEMRLAELRKAVQEGIDSGESTLLNMAEIKTEARRRSKKS